MKQGNRKRYERQAAAYVRSLTTEGYNVMVHYYETNEGYGYCSLKHKQNGNIIHVYVYDDCWKVFKNGFLIKTGDS